MDPKSAKQVDEGCCHVQWQMTAAGAPVGKTIAVAAATRASGTFGARLGRSVEK